MENKTWGLPQNIGIYDPYKFLKIDSTKNIEIGAGSMMDTLKGTGMNQPHNSGYFTPQLSEFMVGYEYEENAASHYDPPSKTWYKRVFKESFGQGYMIGNGIKVGYIRVPYLTKEQIEEEGWVQRGGKEYFYKKEYMLMYEFDKNILHVVLTLPAQKLFTGLCKDISTFRYICKLLGI